MPAPQERDIDKTASLLKVWFVESQGLPDDISINIKGGPENTGFSNETLTFKVKHSNGKSEGYVIRFSPTGYKVFPDYDIKKQYQLMAFLKQQHFTVPEVVAYEGDESILDSSFYLMRECSGEAPSDNPPFHQEGWVFDATPDVRSSLWRNWLDEMIKVHKIEADQSSIEFLNRPHLASNHLDQELAYYYKFHDWAMDGEDHPIADSAREFLKHNHVDTCEETRICQGWNCHHP